MFTKQKTKSGALRSYLVYTIALLGFITGLILFLDGLIFHWFGDLSFLDPTGSDLIHHWHLGLFLMSLSVLLLYLNYKE